jgi:MotA/TolQ/ExbB proton channel family
MKIMLVATLSELYTSGGTIWMHPLTLCLIAIICLVVYIIILQFQKRQIQTMFTEAIKQIGVLALAWGTFSTIAGFFQAFGALEEIKEMLPFQVIMGGMKVALITALYGLIVFILSMLAYIILKLSVKNSID